jgi:hypothetical protein
MGAVAAGDEAAGAGAWAGAPPSDEPSPVATVGAPSGAPGAGDDCAPAVAAVATLGAVQQSRQSAIAAKTVCRVMRSPLVVPRPYDNRRLGGLPRSGARAAA